MKAKLISFGVIEVTGQRFEHDIVIAHGKVTKRRKGPSKPFRDEFGHTPLSAAEEIPWSASRLIVGTGANGQLPIMEDVYREAKRRRVEIVAIPTAEACRLLEAIPDGDVSAILHVTC